MYEAEYHPKIRKDLKKIDLPIREKIRTEHIPRIFREFCQTREPVNIRQEI